MLGVLRVAVNAPSQAIEDQILFQSRVLKIADKRLKFALKRVHGTSRRRLPSNFRLRRHCLYILIIVLEDKMIWIATLLLNMLPKVLD